MSFPELHKNFLQSPAWQRVNQYIGHQAELRRIKNVEYLAIVKSAKRGRYLEIPGGPVMNWGDKELVQLVFSDIKAFAKSTHCAFVRLRPQLLHTPENLQLLSSLGLRIAPMHLHAENTILIDLTQTEAELLASLRRQTRYEVRRADKLQLVVKKSTSEAMFKEFFQVQQDTAKRQHFIPPSLNELLAEHKAFKKQAVIYTAYNPESEPIAYGLILKQYDEADYFEAASTELNRKLPGAYAIQWQVIRDLKAEGYRYYNLWGIAPKGAEHHRYAKVTTFKTGFGGQIVNFVPAHDLVVSKVKYLPDLMIESARKKYRHLG